MAEAIKNNVMDKIKAHFDAKETKIIEVPEWGDDSAPLYIYATPLTLAQKNKLYKMAKDDDLGLMVEVLIMKAKDKSGEPLFGREDKPELMRSCDPDVLIRVASSIMETSDNSDSAAIQKNS